MVKHIRVASLYILTCFLLFSGPETANGAVGDARCMMCHSAATMSKPAGERKSSLYIHQRMFDRSAHGKLSCVDCHADLNGQPLPHRSQLEAVDCARCHQRSHTHPDAIHSNIPLDKDPPVCTDCHGTHYMKPVGDPKSSVNRANSEGTCAKCHTESAHVKDYLGSIHAVVSRKTGVPAASCTDCHPAHSGHTSADPQVCANCHTDEYRGYASGIHGQARINGNTDAPGCVACHGGHDIQRVSDSRSKVHATRVAGVCSECHENAKMQKAYGLASDRLVTYMHSYHGIALDHGDLDVATCTSCHKAHDTRPSSDPASSVNKANLQKTCGACHPGVSAKVAQGKAHVVVSRKEDSLLYFIASGFKWLTIGTMTALVGHICLDLFARIRRRYRAR